MILYKLSRDVSRSSDEKSSVRVIEKWVYVGYSRAHTHDVRALTVAVPISREGDFWFQNPVFVLIVLGFGPLVILLNTCLKCISDFCRYVP